MRNRDAPIETLLLYKFSTYAGTLVANKVYLFNKFKRVASA
jgi:hypothetical protein